MKKIKKIALSTFAILVVGCSVFKIIPAACADFAHIYVNVGDSYMFTTLGDIIVEDTSIAEAKMEQNTCIVTGKKKGTTLLDGVFDVKITVEEPDLSNTQMVLNENHVGYIEILGTDTTPEWKYEEDLNFVFDLISDSQTRAMVSGMKEGDYKVTAIVNRQEFTCDIIVKNYQIDVLKKVEAYQETMVSVSGEPSNVVWSTPSDTLTLKPDGNKCILYTETEGDYTVEALADGCEISAVVTFLKHTHCDDAEWEIVKAATCTEEGMQVKVCTICGQEMLSEKISKTEHVSGTWETIRQATPYQNGIKQKKCEYCYSVLEEEGINYQDLIQNYLYGGAYGYLSIPEVGYDVPLYSTGLSNAQVFVDGSNSAALFCLNGIQIIGDHDYQGFYKMKNSVPNSTVSYITTTSCTTTYICIAKGIGRNTGPDLIDENGCTLLDGNRGTILMYTCNDQPGSITYTYWVRQ